MDLKLLGETHAGICFSSLKQIIGHIEFLPSIEMEIPLN